MKMKRKGMFGVILFLNACVGTDSGKVANAIISLTAVKQAGSTATLLASFPKAADNPNLNVIDSTVKVSITGNIFLNAKDTLVRDFPFPAKYQKTGDIFVFNFPGILELGKGKAVFIGSAKDESGFISSDSVTFVDNCPLDTSPGEYVDPACPL